MTKQELENKFMERADLVAFYAIKFSLCNPVYVAIVMKCLVRFGVLICTAWGVCNQDMGWNEGMEGWKDSFNLDKYDTRKVAVRLHISINNRAYAVQAKVSLDDLIVQLKVTDLDPLGYDRGRCVIIERMLRQKLESILEDANKEVCEDIIKFAQDTM